MLSNVSTLVTKNLIHEFLILHKSLQLFNPETKIVVMCDDESVKIINTLSDTNIIVLNELKQLNYSAIKLRKKHFLKLVLRKCDVMKYALDKFGETLFVDTDIVFLNPFEVVSEKQLVLSQHHIEHFFEEKYGKYNVGYLLIRDKSFPEWLRKATINRSKYFEQECLNYAEKEFDTEVFSMNHNFGWWRLYQYKHPGERYQKFDYGSTIFWDGKPLVSVHVHMCADGFKNEYNDYHNNMYADIMMEFLLASASESHNELYYYIAEIRNSQKNRPVEKSGFYTFFLELLGKA